MTSGLIGTGWAGPDHRGRQLPELAHRRDGETANASYRGAGAGDSQLAQIVLGSGLPRLHQGPAPVRMAGRGGGLGQDQGFSVYPFLFTAESRPVARARPPVRAARCARRAATASYPAAARLCSASRSPAALQAIAPGADSRTPRPVQTPGGTTCQLSCSHCKRHRRTPIGLRWRHKPGCRHDRYVARPAGPASDLALRPPARYRQTRETPAIRTR
jgi:hypothetical protein